MRKPRDAFNCIFQGKLDAVRSAASEGARVSRQAGDQHTLMNWLINLGTADLMAGDLNEAKSVLVEGLQVPQEIDDRTAMSYLVEALACHAVATDDEQ